MARIRRRDLKRDRFVEEVTHQVEYVSGYRRQFLWGGIALVVALVGGVGYWSFDRQQTLASNAALNEAITLFNGIVSDQDQRGVKTFASEAERIEQVTRAMDELTLDYARTAAAAGASYYSGLLDREEGNVAEAQSHFEQAARGRGSEYPTLARIALGLLLFEGGDAEAARVQFRAVMDKPSRTVSRDQAAIELAKTFIASDPEQARDLLGTIQSENGPASSMAAALLETFAEGG